MYREDVLIDIHMDVSGALDSDPLLRKGQFGMSVSWTDANVGETVEGLYEVFRGVVFFFFFFFFFFFGRKKL